jgi:hypothetical protein
MTPGASDTIAAALPGSPMVAVTYTTIVMDDGR